MEFTYYVRRPFAVEAIEITLENMEEVAKLIGSVRKKGDTSFISIDRRLVPNVSRAYAGWWLTRLADNYRVYSPKLFKGEFLPYEDAITFTFDDEDENGTETDESSPKGTLRPVPNISDA
jgi:hypothetical protein